LDVSPFLVIIPGEHTHSSTTFLLLFGEENDWVVVPVPPNAQEVRRAIITYNTARRTRAAGYLPLSWDLVEHDLRFNG